VDSVLTILEWTGNDPYGRIEVPTAWVSYDKLREHIAAQVPPGYALRTFNDSRDSTWRKRNGKVKGDPVPQRRRKLPTHQVIRSGQLGIATRVVNSNFYEKSPPSDDAERMIRLRRVPRFNARDMPRKERPPKATERVAPPSLLDETEYREAMRDLAAVDSERERLLTQIGEYEELVKTG
jgi:hypothetical protein